MEVGFIGVGNMGGQMVRNLLDKGYSVTIYDLRPEVLEPLAAAGARTAPDIAALCARHDFILMSLPDHRASEQVMMGPGGILASLRQPGLLVADLATGLPEAARRIHAAAKQGGVAYLDAPVSGGPDGARAGTLSIIVGGEKEVLDRATVLFKDLGKEVYYIGPAGLGSAAKLINNMLGYTCVMASIEGMTMGAKLGIDPEVLYRMVCNSSGGSYEFQKKVPRILRRDFAVRYPLDLQYKDISLATQLAEEVGVPVPVANMVKQISAMGRQLGLGSEDYSSLVKVYETFAKVEVRGPDASP